MLITKTARPLLPTLALLATIGPFGAIAQPLADGDDSTDSKPLWYQIEVLIFANEEPFAEGPERWPEEVELAYPEDLVNLSAAVDMEPAATRPADNSATGSINPPAPLPATSDPLLDQAFVELDREQWQLQNIATSILRQGQFRLLFHKAWRQPTRGRQDSISVLVRGGDQYDDHRELEGWLQLSVERYLHLKTDLWLSSFKSTAGLRELPWPKLPAIPLSLAAPQADAGVESPYIDSGLNDLMPTFPQRPVFYLADRQYVVDRTVVLRQSRRMRSDELHYIDHPLMGVLVKVTPWEVEPEPAADETGDAEPLSAGGEG